MVRVITQETFDSVVKENMEEFEMSREDAIKEAIEQFQSQGVELSNIVTTTLAEDHPILKSIERLKTLSADQNVDSIVDEVKQLCDILSVECSKGLAEKMLATNEGAYETLVSVAEAKSANIRVRESALAALASLLDGNPDPLDESGFKVIAETLSMANDVERGALAKVTLGLTLNCCVRHEQNRQNLVHNGLLDKLDSLFDLHPVEVARVWQSLVQDDDVRVPYGKAHDHAREIVEEHQALHKLVEPVKDVQRCPKDTVLLMSCLSNLCVRNEYCQAVVDNAGLTTIFTLLIDPDQKRDVVKECLKLLKVLAGNDNVKRDIAASKGLETIVNAINKHIGNGSICNAGCGAITALCLRTPDNCKQVMEAGGAQMIVQVLKTHMDTNSDVLISAAAAIRNIVCRSKEFCKEFIDLDIEQILNEVMSKHPETSDGVRAALRDLELKVHLNEEWKGETINIKSNFRQSWD